MADSHPRHLNWRAGEGGVAPFYYSDGEGHAVLIRWWLPYGHPDRAEVVA